jgi:hypothetical protein
MVMADQFIKRISSRPDRIRDRERERDRRIEKATVVIRMSIEDKELLNEAVIASGKSMNGLCVDWIRCGAECELDMHKQRTA